MWHIARDFSLGGVGGELRRYVKKWNGNGTIPLRRQKSNYFVVLHVSLKNEQGKRTKT